MRDLWLTLNRADATFYFVISNVLLQQAAELNRRTLMTKKIIIGVNVTSFAKNSGEVQAVFQEFGCSIRTRLGLHEASDNVCAPNGLILVEFVGGAQKAAEMTAKLTALPGIEVKQMEF
ncbi:MAG: hypothetical protein LBN39_10060 [Planctomycetaceae bacterium]|nr:hypothetical protein [Planctomycetaceae bacterium]